MNDKIDEINDKWHKIIMLQEHGAKREIDLEAYRDLMPIIEKQQQMLETMAEALRRIRDDCGNNQLAKDWHIHVATNALTTYKQFMEGK